MGAPVDDLQLDATEKLLLKILCGDFTSYGELNDKLKVGLGLFQVKTLAPGFHDYKLFQPISEDQRQELWHSLGFIMPETIAVKIKHPFKQETLDRVKLHIVCKLSPDQRKRSARKESFRRSILLLDRDGDFYWWHSTYVRRFTSGISTGWDVESSEIVVATASSLVEATSTNKWLFRELVKKLKEESEKESKKRQATAKQLDSALATVELAGKKAGF